MRRVITFLGGPLDGMSRAYDEIPPDVSFAMAPKQRWSDAWLGELPPNEADHILCRRVTYSIRRVPGAVVDEMEDGVQRYVGVRVPDPDSR